MLPRPTTIEDLIILIRNLNLGSIKTSNIRIRNLKIRITRITRMMIKKMLILILFVNIALRKVIESGIVTFMNKIRKIIKYTQTGSRKMLQHYSNGYC
jgi:hypothetical protein